MTETTAPEVRGPKLHAMDQVIGREERYESFCCLVAERGRADALHLLDVFDADTGLIHEADQRWGREHVLNMAGRVEGTVTRDVDGWTGVAGRASRTFPTEVEAAYWVRHLCEVPATHIEHVRANAASGGANPAWAHLDEEAS